MGLKINRDILIQFKTGLKIHDDRGFSSGMRKTEFGKLTKNDFKDLDNQVLLFEEGFLDFAL